MLPWGGLGETETVRGGELPSTLPLVLDVSSPGREVGQLCKSVQVFHCCVPAVAANRPPKFLPNMTSVILPEDLPVGE